MKYRGVRKRNTEIETQREKRKRGEKQKEMNILMKGKSEQRKQWWKKKREKCWKKKSETKRDWTKTKNEGFLYDFGGFKAKREEIKNNHFKKNGKTERIFPAQKFF